MLRFRLSVRRVNRTFRFRDYLKSPLICYSVIYYLFITCLIFSFSFPKYFTYIMIQLFPNNYTFIVFQLLEKIELEEVDRHINVPIHYRHL